METLHETIRDLPLTEDLFWSLFGRPDVNKCVDDFWVTDGRRCRRFLGDGSDAWSRFNDSFPNTI